MSFVDSTDPFWREMNSIAAAEGLEIYDLEQIPPSHLRVTIDRLKPAEGSAAEGGAGADDPPAPLRERVSSGDCSKLCRRLMAFFLVEGPRFGISTEPEIEVSSPGVNRNLRRPEHFAAARGERVRVVSMTDYQGAERFPLIGTVIESDRDTVRLAIEDSDAVAALPISRVRKAHVDFRFE